MKSYIFVVISFFFVAQSFSAIEAYHTKLDPSVKVCSKDPMGIAQEIIKTELAGRRYQKAKDKCISDLKLKYVVGDKNPDNSSNDLFKVKGNEIEIKSLKYNKNFYTYEIRFEAKGPDGKIKKDLISFMVNGDLGKKRPKEGCALYASEPATTYVSESCL